jgi:hypothetical protein
LRKVPLIVNFFRRDQVRTASCSATSDACDAKGNGEVATELVENMRVLISFGKAEGCPEV